MRFQHAGLVDLLTIQNRPVWNEPDYTSQIAVCGPRRVTATAPPAVNIQDAALSFPIIELSRQQRRETSVPCLLLTA